MLEIIQERRRAERVEHCLAFTDNDGCGYNFDCDEKGNVVFNPEFEECQRKNYEAAMAAGPEAFPVEFNHHTVRRFRYTENAIGRYRCGEEFELYVWTVVQYVRTGTDQSGVLGGRLTSYSHS